MTSAFESVAIIIRFRKPAVRTISWRSPTPNPEERHT